MKVDESNISNDRLKLEGYSAAQRCVAIFADLSRRLDPPKEPELQLLVENARLVDVVATELECRRRGRGSVQRCD